ncbi:hypothetical protein [Paenibacillus sp. Leaf72]|uniref:hypothetical protein n=1 Tax=Paenibacillus sp. Leaf72 TaxID=1736234 RepID=UPI0006F598F4|nr:hypothetical protein [Paenibacillus sp. Leaf72]KQN96907.1 hypothetical protein ASF12_22830 [Paenibacillus sp. Leaf72]
MYCTHCGARQSNGTTDVERVIKEGEFTIINVPALICLYEDCGKIQLEPKAVRKMHQIRTDVINGVRAFETIIPYDRH